MKVTLPWSEVYRNLVLMYSGFLMGEYFDPPKNPDRLRHIIVFAGFVVFTLGVPYLLERFWGDKDKIRP